MICLENITVNFDDKTVLENLSYKFCDNTVYALMGESGCGKTTILNVISGLVKPINGSISIDNDRISYVFQEPRLYDWLSATDNVALVMDIPKKNARDKAKEILSALGLADSLSLFPFEMSGGMKQRVSIARALAYSPDVLLLDEPFKALDDETRLNTAKYIFSVMNGKTVIMVTHDERDVIYSDFVARFDKSPISKIEMVKSSK